MLDKTYKSLKKPMKPSNEEPYKESFNCDTLCNKGFLNLTVGKPAPSVLLMRNPETLLLIFLKTF